MGKIFTLDAATKSIITDALDDLITELGKNCRLVYPPQMVSCINCVKDPIGNKSANRWKTGGPIPFSNGMTCPMCGGEGFKAIEHTEDVLMLCAWEPKHFYYPLSNLNIRIPYSIVQTKFFLTELPKVEQCDHLVFQTNIEGVALRKFKLYGEPGDRANIIQDRYAVATWERVLE